MHQSHVLDCWILRCRQNDFLLLYMCGSVAQSCLTLCDPMDCSPPGSSVHGILQARILECVVIPFSRGSSPPKDQIQVSCTAGRIFYQLREALTEHTSCCYCFIAKSSPTLCNPMDCSPPGSSVHGILQARILQWVAYPFSRGSSRPRN